MKILDLGCGLNKTPGAFGIDGVSLPGVDLVHDLDKFPYPVEANSFDRIVVRHVIEHVESIVKVMEEIHRVATPGAIVEIYTPHFTSVNSYVDPTHRHHLSLLTLDFFCGGTQHGYVTSAKFKMVKRTVNFWALHDSLPWLNYQLIGMKCLAERHPVFYERFLAFIFPIKEITVELQVVK